MRVLVEVCVADLRGALEAAKCGVDGVELCAWPGCGGITPSSGLVQQVVGQVPVPVRVLIRPGPGGFRYGSAERALIGLEAQHIHALHKSLGLVIGALDGSGQPDADLINTIRRMVGSSELTFHRAMDHTTDPMKALEQCLASGVDRILSSGCAPTALQGTKLLAELVELAGNRLLVTAGGGVGPHNVVELVERTGVREVHFAALQLETAADGPPMSSTDPGSDRPLGTDVRKIEGVLDALAKAGLR
ncbi:MAG: hypothetical protein KF905_07960 [Flavobacteriales bacterium]|nr:hypothetical protein [Flavobacteriales bacterium]